MRNQFPTPEQNHSLPISVCGGSIESTITINADRKRYLSGIFLPTIHQNYGITTPEVYSEFAVRATRRNKTGNRTNNADCLMAVVEPLPHPIQAVSFTNKLTETIKMNPIQHTARNATTAPIVFTSDVLEVVYA